MPLFAVAVDADVNTYFACVSFIDGCWWTRDSGVSRLGLVTEK
jgi:hypothetical protein